MTTTIAFDLVKDNLLMVEQKMRSQADQDYIDLQSALHHLLRSGGKRIRPTLTLLTGALLDAENRQLITLAAAIEMLHTATLVHDDLIDGSLLRRGMPTINAQWSPAATVLTGDYLFARSAALAAEADNLPAMHLFAETLGTIVNGEITQLFSRNDKLHALDRSRYYQRIHSKTASLFRTSTAVAALVCGADEEVIENISQFGLKVGMAFQIIDDILDFSSDKIILGKPVGGDLRQGIITLPAIYYLESLSQDKQQEIILLITKQQENGLNALIETIRDSNAIERSYKEAHNFIEGAVSSLSSFPSNLEHQALEELAWYIIERKI